MDLIEIMNYINVAENPNVYPPREDSWFLADTIIKEFQNQKSIFKRYILVCEIGVGTGFISIVLGKEFPWIQIVGTDISLKALALCNHNMKKHLKSRMYRLICCNLLNAFNPAKFHPDIIFFNPPYVKTTYKELNSRDNLIRTWAGGPKGISVISNFLENITKFSFKIAFFISTSSNENSILLKEFSHSLKIIMYSKRKVEDETLICYMVTPMY